MTSALCLEWVLTVVDREKRMRDAVKARQSALDLPSAPDRSLARYAYLDLWQLGLSRYAQHQRHRWSKEHNS
jgi:hypothetical protein